MSKYQEYFLGSRVSEEGLRYGRVDYCCLASAFNHVLCNDILTHVTDYELINGSEYNYINPDGDLLTYSDFLELDTDTQEDCKEEYKEIYQWYIIDSSGQEILSEYTNELVIYLPEFDLYLWGVDHWGTSWEYVLTDIELKEMEDK